MPIISAMSLFKIIGLKITTTSGNSYETSPHSNYILHDDDGKGITKQRMFTSYIVYIERENEYHAIHLSVCHCASSRGKLCTLADMSVDPSNYEEVMINITHVPSAPPAYIELQMKEYYEDEFLRLYNNQDTCVLQFSKDGNDERTPYGFVYVNMDLFTSKITYG